MRTALRERDTKNEGGEPHAARSLPAPVRMVGNRATPDEFGLPAVGVIDAPMAADGAFELALPGLIIGLDQVHLIILAPGVRQHLMHHAPLVDRRWQGTLAHAAGARPAEFAHQDVLVGKGSDHLPADGIDVTRRVARRDGEVLPVGQDMDADEIDGRGDLAVAQPEFPHVGIGHRHRDLRLDLTDDANQFRSGHLAPQQDFVSDDDGDDHVWKTLRQPDRSLDLVTAAIRPIRQPQTLQHLHTVTFGDFRDLVEPVIDRVRPYAVGDVFELGQILVDLPRIDGNIGPERVLVPSERGIRDAMKLSSRRERGRGHLDHGSQPSPHRHDRCSGNREKRTCNAHCGQSHPTRNASLIVLQRRCQASASAAYGDFFASLPFPILASRHAAALIIVQYRCGVRRNADRMGPHVKEPTGRQGP